MSDRVAEPPAPPAEIELAALIGVALALKRRALASEAAALPPSNWRAQGRREQQQVRQLEALRWR